MSSENPINDALARQIKLVIFDVDGVLTDAGIYVGETESGESVELKRFDIQDGIGLKMLMWAGLEVAIVSGRVSKATTLRAAELEIDECHQAPNAHKLVVAIPRISSLGRVLNGTKSRCWLTTSLTCPCSGRSASKLR